jgi:hypothetical protein
MSRGTQERPKGDPMAGPSRLWPLGDQTAEFRRVPTNPLLTVAG